MVDTPVPQTRGLSNEELEINLHDQFGSMAPVHHTVTRRTGLHGEFNWAATDEGTQYYGKIGSSKTTFTTHRGQLVVCNPKAVSRFTGFLNELYLRGYDAKDVSALAIRQKRGGSDWSIHSWGAAMDVDPEDNPFQPGVQHVVTVFPDKVEQLGWKYGLAWGARFGDSMHFEAGSPDWWKGRLDVLVQTGYISAGLAEKIKEANNL